MSDLKRLAGNRGLKHESHQPELEHDKFRGPVPSEPTDWDGTNGVTNFGMDCNGPDPSNPPAFPQGLGDCGAAATDHAFMVQAGAAATPGTLGAGSPVVAPYPGIDPVVGTYFAYGVSQGEQGQPPAAANEPDQGVDNASWLAFLRASGLIYGYVEVPAQQANLYAPGLGGVLLGVSLPDDAEQQFESGIAWGQQGDSPNPANGHDVLLVKTNADGSGTVVTWGALQEVTADFLNRYVVDAWAFIDPDDPTVDHAALQAALDALPGAVGSFPTGVTNGAVPSGESLLAKVESDIKKVLDDGLAEIRAAASSVTEDELTSLIKSAAPQLLRELEALITHL